MTDRTNFSIGLVPQAFEHVIGRILIFLIPALVPLLALPADVVLLDIVLLMRLFIAFLKN
jgi:hypothetical protein